MRTIASMVGRELHWTQPSVFRRKYELRADDIVVARLEWVKFFGMAARAESADGCWLFDRVGMWSPKIVVRTCAEETPIVTFVEKWFGKKQPVVLPSGETLTVKSGFLGWTLTLDTSTGELLVQMKRHSFFSRAYDVELRRRGASYQEFPWLVMLVWYLGVLARRRQARATAG